MKVDSNISEIMQELASGLKSVYGNKLKSVILYGSAARGTHTDDSDIDIMVLVDERSDSLEKYEEGLSEVSTDMALKYLKVFSIIDVSYDEYMKWENSLPFYKNVSQEGVVVYAA